MRSNAITLDSLKEKVKSFGSELISYEKHGTSWKLKVKCNVCGGVFNVYNKKEMVSSEFSCKKCRSENQYKESRDRLKKIIESSGCKLLERISGNSTSPARLKIQCSCGRIYETSDNQLKKGTRCHFCSGRYSFEDVKDFCQSRNIELLSTSYDKQTKPIKIRCVCCGKIIEKRIDAILKHNSVKCKSCASYGDLTKEKIIELFKEKNREVIKNKLPEILLRNKSPIFYKCSCGREHFITWSNFSRGHNQDLLCPVCQGIIPSHTRGLSRKDWVKIRLSLNRKWNLKREKQHIDNPIHHIIPQGFLPENSELLKDERNLIMLDPWVHVNSHKLETKLHKTMCARYKKYQHELSELESEVCYKLQGIILEARKLGADFDKILEENSEMLKDLKTRYYAQWQ